MCNVGNVNIKNTCVWSPANQTNQKTSPNSSSVGLIVGTTVGSLALIVTILLIIYKILKRHSGIDNEVPRLEID